MTSEKQQALERLKAAEKEIQACKEILNTPDKQAAKEWLQAQWENAKKHIGISDDGCVTFYNSDEKTKWLFQQDWKNKRLYYSYYRIWQFLNSEYGMETSQIGTLVMEVVSVDLNCVGLTPWLRVF